MALSNPPSSPPEAPARRRGVTLRALFVGLFFCLAIAVGEPYGVLVLRSSPMAADFSTGAALFLFFLLTFLINPFARLVSGSGLRRGELATVYIMMIVSAAIPSWGLTMNLIPLIAGFFYYATPENEWVTLIHPFLPQILTPSDQTAVQHLFEGAARDGNIPWATWAKPLVVWSLFVVTVYFVTLCLLVILRKQWVVRERLTFPLATLPLEMGVEGQDHAVPPFFRNYLTWVGFSIPAIIGSINALHSYFNIIPFIDLNADWFFLRRSVYIDFEPRFEVVGLSYLLNLDVSLGIWLFALLNQLCTGGLRLLGWSIGPQQPYSGPSPPSLAHVGLGALFFLVFSGLWMGRRHLQDVWRKAWHNDPDVDDSDELLSYRVAVSGVLIGSALSVMWLHQVGMNLVTAGVFLLSALVVFVGLARIVSQAGLAYCRSPVAPPVFTVNVLGSSAVGPAGLTSLALNFPWSADSRTFVMASAATGLKLAEVTRLESRRLFWAIAAAILVTIVGSAWAVIKLGYAYGGVNMGGWQFGSMTTFTGNWITRYINNPEPIHHWYVGFTGLGAGLMGLLTFVKYRFVGFPIHPIGLALGLPHPLPQVWPSVFIAWILKALILKYGGAGLYRRLRPLFLGLVLGVFGTAGIWLIIDGLTGMSGNRLITIG